MSAHDDSSRPEFTDSAADALGTRAASFPPYDISRALGAGGMGVVYLARHTRLDRFVALKLLSPERSSELAARFEREVRMMAQFKHPNIVSLYDSGETPEGRLYLAMEYVEGATLAELIADPPASFDPRAIAIQVCDALAYAHGEGVVHRDIKPGNVLVDAGGRVKVADFGLARRLSAEESMLLTTAGKVMGTPGYMAPEQMRGETVDQRTDLFALGALIYEMLCGERPTGVFDLPSTRAGCDPRWDAIVHRAMQPDPARRYGSATEMRAAIEALATAPAAVEVARPSGRGRARVFAGCVALVVLTAGGWFMRDRGEVPPPRLAPATPMPTPDPNAEWIAATRTDVPAVKADSSALTAVALREEEWIDLLPHVDPARDSIRGTWEKTVAGLACTGPFPWSLCSIPVREPEGEYDLRFRVTRGEGAHLAMFFLFRKNGTGGYVPIDYIDRGKPEFADGRRGAGLENIGLPMFAPGGLMARRSEWLPKGRTSTVVLQVREAGVRLLVDGTEAYRWPADWSKLRQSSGAGGSLFHSLPPQPFFGVGIYGCTTVFHRIEIRRAAAATSEPAPTAPWVASEAPAPPVYPAPKEWIDVTDTVRSSVLTGGRGEVTGEWLHVVKAGHTALCDNRSFRDVALRATYKGRLFLVLRDADSRHPVANLSARSAMLWHWNADDQAMPSFVRQTVPLGPGYDPKQEHVATFVAQGDRLALWIDGRLVATQFDDTAPAGAMAVQLFSPSEAVEPLWIRKVEYGVLGE